MYIYIYYCIIYTHMCVCLHMHLHVCVCIIYIYMHTEIMYWCLIILAEFPVLHSLDSTLGLDSYFNSFCFCTLCRRWFHALSFPTIFGTTSPTGLALISWDELKLPISLATWDTNSSVSFAFSTCSPVKLCGVWSHGPYSAHQDPLIDGEGQQIIQH